MPLNEKNRLPVIHGKAGKGRNVVCVTNYLRFPFLTVMVMESDAVIP